MLNPVEFNGVAKGDSVYFKNNFMGKVISKEDLSNRKVECKFIVYFSNLNCNNCKSGFTTDINSWHVRKN